MSFDDFQIKAITNGFIIIWGCYWGVHCITMSSKRPADILPNEQFALYLRGFSFDNYNSIRTLQKQSQFKNFSEYHFFSILNKYLPVYSVGMTKELSAPLGATRIYLNDAEWEKDVQELIQKAELIIMLVNDSDSCIWEMEQCYYLDKTMLIVDDKEKFASIRRYFAKRHTYPFPISINSQTILFHNKEDGYSQITFGNTEKSYNEVIQHFMKEKYGIRRWIISSWQRNLLIGLVVILILSAFFVMIFANINLSNAEIMLYMLASVIATISLYILYSTPMSKRRKLKAGTMKCHS